MSQDLELKNKRVLIFQQRGWGMRIGHFLAKKLKDEGCILGALTTKRSVYNFVKKQKEIDYKIVFHYDDIIDEPEKFLAGDDYSLEQICDDLDIDSVWTLVQSLRLYARSYREKYYYSYRQEISDEDIITHVKACYKAVKYIFEDFKPDVILLPNFTTIFHIFLDLYGRKSGVKTIRIIDSRVRGVGILVEGYRAQEGRFFDRIKELDQGAESNNFKKAKDYIEKTRAKLQVPIYSDHGRNIFAKKSLIKRIREELAPYRKSIRYLTGKNINQLKRFKVMVDYLSPYYLLRDHYVDKINTWHSNHFPYYDFKKVKKYIYIPLQFNPEETVDVSGARYNNQIETIRQIAMSAPGDYTVVVKDHPAMLGKQGRSYLEKVARTPNVKLIDYRIPSEQIIRNADLIINISGTSLAEAAFLKKPAIQLGELGVTKVLPNIFIHSDLTTIDSTIKKALKTDFNTSEYDKKLLDFVAAAYDTGSDADYVGIWWGKTTDKIEDMWRMYKDEIIYCLNKKK